MNADEFARSLPDFANNALPLTFPSVFNGMSARIFPLRASLDVLQRLCQGYLNFIPPEAGVFRAMVPYVYLMVLDYGQITEAVSRLGWYAQHEVFFSVPVEWYTFVNGRFVFKDWALFTPYIFVDDSFSVPIGRTVYGFPKSLAKLTMAKNHWIRNPVAPITLVRAETEVFPEAYAGERLVRLPFLEIERDAPMSNFRVPLDPSSPMAPWVMANNLAQAMAGFGRDAMWMAQSMRIFPLTPLNTPGVLPEMLSRIPAFFMPGGKGFIQNSLNLKQFRRADMPQQICYQAVTVGQMITTALNGAGLLGEERTMTGDLSGGHTIKLFNNSSLPITRTLGLEVQSEGPSHFGDVSILKPVLPFWIDANILYNEGNAIAWRGQEGPWRDATGARIQTGYTGVDTAGDVRVYNSSAPSAIAAVSGPFRFTGTTIRVLPLLAKKECLQSYVDSFINDPLKSPIAGKDGVNEKLRLSVWSRPKARVNLNGVPIGGDHAYVYLTASSYTDVTSKSNNVGDWAKSELAFMIPVKFERCLDGEWQVQGVGMVPAFYLVDDCIAAESRMEVQGFDVRTATFVQPESQWLTDTNAGESSKLLLSVDAEVFPAFNAGQKTITRTVIEIKHLDQNAGLGEGDIGDVAFSWAEMLRLELGTKRGTASFHPRECRIARALALELLGNRVPVSVYTLKQFRDAHDPDKACFQELVRVPRVLSEVFDVREIEETLVVTLHDFPTLKIAETLGIEATAAPCDGAGIEYNAQAIRPFFIRATVDEPLAECLVRRVGTQQWTLLPGAFDGFLSVNPNPPGILADFEAEHAQNQLGSSDPHEVMFRAFERRRSNDTLHRSESSSFAQADVHSALWRVDPQIVIETALSREWNNRDENSRRRRGRSELLRSIAALPLTGAKRVEVETAWYALVNNTLAKRPGAVAAPLDVAKVTAAPPSPPSSDMDLQQETSWADDMARMIRQQQFFIQRELDLEEAYNQVAMLLVPTAASELKAVPVADYLKTAPATPLEALKTLDQRLRAVTELEVLQPIDGVVAARRSRLKELLDDFERELQSAPEALMSRLLLETDAVFQMVDYARQHCRAQQDALINKLSRAYQKPDFCVRRDSLGRHGTELLADALSWDEEWYFGIRIPEGELKGPVVEEEREKCDGTATSARPSPPSPNPLQSPWPGVVGTVHPRKKTRNRPEE